MSEKATVHERGAVAGRPSYLQFGPVHAPDFLAMEKATDWLRTTKGAVPAGLQRGEIPGRKVGGEWRISATAVLDVFRTAVPDGNSS